VTLVVERFLGAVERSPTAAAVTIGPHAVSYRTLLATVSATLAHLHASGIGPGDCVGLTMTQSPLHLATFLALARLGAVVVPLSTMLAAPERSAIIRKFGVTALVADRPVPDDGCRSVVFQAIEARGDEWRLDAAAFVPEAATPLRIALTSGTTAGIPKGVMQSHGDFAARLDRLFCGPAAEVRVIPPNFAITIGLNLSLFALGGGGTVVLPLQYDHASFCDTIRRGRVSVVPLPPSHVAALVAGLPAGSPAFPSVTQLRFLGATPSAALLQRARERFSPHVFATYAMGEIGPVAVAGADLLERDPGTSGRVCRGARLEVLDAAGVPVAPGVSGEIRVAVDGMPAGYHGSDAGDRSRFRDGWFHPGDRGRISSAGLVFVEGRSDDIINVGGRKMAPATAEAILEGFPGVGEAAVFAAQNAGDLEGALVTAAIVVSGKLDWKALAAHARQRLEATAPLRYLEVARLPRNAMGKLVRDGLRDLAETEGVER
jgi:acyl-coenzyme A synthetase/AMP-(fatty) acid ligase